MLVWLCAVSCSPIELASATADVPPGRRLAASLIRVSSEAQSVSARDPAELLRHFGIRESGFWCDPARAPRAASSIRPARFWFPGVAFVGATHHGIVITI